MKKSPGPPDSPVPPDPEERREPLPTEAMKPAVDDPGAADRVRKLLDSSAYRRADHDLAFLDSDDARGIRLELDFLKPETLIQAAGVVHTIVVFGGTRIIEPRAAERRLKELRNAAGDKTPGAQALETAECIRQKSAYYTIAREFGAIVGRAGRGPDDCRITLMTGGGPGIMEAANRGASDVGAKSIGLNITLPREQYPNPYISEDLCFSVHYFAIRKLHFLMRARALVAFPGGYGTLDELFETLTLVQTRKIRPLPIVLVGRQFWDRAIDPDFLVAEGVIDPEDRELFSYAEDADEIWSQICSWYEAAGTPLTCQ